MAISLFLEVKVLKEKDTSLQSISIKYIFISEKLR